jgi:hypothetical protein
MLMPFFITVIEFISCHPLRLHAVSKLSAESRSSDGKTFPVTSTRSASIWRTFQIPLRYFRFPNLSCIFWKKLASY